MSGLQFFTINDPILQGTPTNHRVLAFADDLGLMSDSADELQTSIDATHNGLEMLELRLNASKCASLHVRANKRFLPCRGQGGGLSPRSCWVRYRPAPLHPRWDHQHWSSDCQQQARVVAADRCIQNIFLPVDRPFRMVFP